MGIGHSTAAGSFLVAIVVGLTGMGGGALMTPMLMLFFGVPPLAAVSSDLVASAVMKPVGRPSTCGAGTVNLRLVGWLCVGSVPAAFCGVLVARAFGDGEQVQNVDPDRAGRRAAARRRRPGRPGVPAGCRARRAAGGRREDRRRRESRRSPSGRSRPCWSARSAAWSSA